MPCTCVTVRLHDDSVPVVGIDVFTVEADAQQQQCTEVLSRTLDPKWGAGANKFKFDIADAHQMVCVRMFAATQDGDVQLGNSAILLHDAFGSALDTGSHMVVSLDLPLILVRDSRGECVARIGEARSCSRHDIRDMCPCMPCHSYCRTRSL